MSEEQKQIDNGGPAYPLNWEKQGEFWAFGMTLRDYFAARYMQGLAANPTCTATFHGGGLHETAEWAYRMADAMLSARGTEKERDK